MCLAYYYYHLLILFTPDLYQSSRISHVLRIPPLPSQCFFPYQQKKQQPWGHYWQLPYLICCADSNLYLLSLHPSFLLYMAIFSLSHLSNLPYQSLSPPACVVQTSMSSNTVSSIIGGNLLKLCV